MCNVSSDVVICLYQLNYFSLETSRTSLYLGCTNNIVSWTSLFKVRGIVLKLSYLECTIVSCRMLYPKNNINFGKFFISNLLDQCALQLRETTNAIYVKLCQLKTETFRNIRSMPESFRINVLNSKQVKLPLI